MLRRDEGRITECDMLRPPREAFQPQRAPKDTEGPSVFDLGLCGGYLFASVFRPNHRWLSAAQMGTDISHAADYGVRVRVVVTVVGAIEAERVTWVVVVTAVWVTLKVADVLPAGIVIAVGTVAAGLLVDRVTVRPPMGAGPVRVTVPVTVVFELP